MVCVKVATQRNVKSSFIAGCFIQASEKILKCDLSLVPLVSTEFSVKCSTQIDVNLEN